MSEAVCWFVGRLKNVLEVVMQREFSYEKHEIVRRLRTTKLPRSEGSATWEGICQLNIIDS